MSDAPVEPFAQPVAFPDLPCPREVKIAAICTWIGSALALVLTVLLALGAFILGPWMFADQSPGTLVGWLLSLVGATLVLAVLGNIAAYFLLRRRRWAHRALVILWAVAASIGVGISLSVSGGFVVWVPSVAVVVVLLTPKVRTWLASPS